MRRKKQRRWLGWSTGAGDCGRGAASSPAHRCERAWGRARCPRAWVWGRAPRAPPHGLPVRDSVGLCLLPAPPHNLRRRHPGQSGSGEGPSQRLLLEPAETGAPRAPTHRANLQSDPRKPKAPVWPPPFSSPLTLHPSRSPMLSTSRAPTLPSAPYLLFSNRSVREGMKTLWRPSSGACPQESRPQRGGVPRGHIQGGGLLGVRTGEGADSEAQGDWAATAGNWPRSKMGREYWKRDSAYERTEPPTPAEKMSGSP